MALIDLVDNISCNFVEKKYTVGVFLDLSNAFDTIDHTILTNKRQCYGVRGSACNWFVSYLQNWKQYVIFNKTESECKEISCGVPQGSILGPLLLILYINDIEHVSDFIKPILCVDDTSLFHSHTCFNTLIQEVNIQLHKCSTSFNTSKLSLNTKKSNFIIFTPNGKKYNISEAERKLQLLQKKAIRIITSSHYIAHTDPLFSMTKLLKLDDLYKYQLGIFMHKVTHFQLPQNMSSMFLRTEIIHKHIRNQNAYCIQHIRTNTRKSTINFSGPKFWKTLPASLGQLVSIHQFKNKLKELPPTKFP